MNTIKDKVRLYLKISALAGLSKDELLDKYPNAIYLEDIKTDTQGFMIPLLDTLLISFRGTQQDKDWITDFNGFHEVVPYGNYHSDVRVHRGFIGAYRSVRDVIHAYINKNPDIKNIRIAGHSLGAALATLCAVDMQYNFPDKDISCYPSGGPKVGNKAFVRSYNKRVPDTYRTYMRTDIVPTLPPAWLEKMFKQRSYHTAIGNPIGPRNIFIGILNWIKRRFKTSRFAADLTNHSIELYLEHVDTSKLKG